MLVGACLSDRSRCHARVWIFICVSACKRLDIKVPNYGTRTPFFGVQLKSSQSRAVEMQNHLRSKRIVTMTTRTHRPLPSNHGKLDKNPGSLTAAIPPPLSLEQSSNPERTCQCAISVLPTAQTQVKRLLYPPTIAKIAQLPGSSNRKGPNFLGR
jgi:hypothetical protein